MFLAEEEEAGFSNACVLVGRDGEPAVTYRKEFPVFDCDFGRLGMQICFDGCYPEGWAALGATGAEVVVWPTMSPQTVRPAAYAHEHGYHVVTSTWRNNATIFRPNGMVAAQIRDPDRLLVHRIDLSYAVVTWQPALRNGLVLTEAYGDAVGFHYSEAEDQGVFWSNDPHHPVGSMLEELGLETMSQVLERNRALQDEKRPGPVPGRG